MQKQDKPYGVDILAESFAARLRENGFKCWWKLVSEIMSYIHLLDSIRLTMLLILLVRLQQKHIGYLKRTMTGVSQSEV